MIISDKHEFIFIAVPKTATTSIEKVLRNYGEGVTSARDGKHMTARELKETVDPEKWERYFKFAFVRHPLDWTLSWYTFRTREDLLDPNHPNHHRSTRGIPFEKFVKESMWGESTQCDFIMDDDRLLVDFVGHFERLNDDFDEVCRRVGIPTTKLPVRNRSPDADYTELYDDELKGVVLRANHREMKYLGYTDDYEWQRREFSGLNISLGTIRRLWLKLWLPR